MKIFEIIKTITQLLGSTLFPPKSQEVKTDDEINELNADIDLLEAEDKEYTKLEEEGSTNDTDGKSDSEVNEESLSSKSENKFNDLVNSLDRDIPNEDKSDIDKEIDKKYISLKPQDLNNSNVTSKRNAKKIFDNLNFFDNKFAFMYSMQIDALKDIRYNRKLIELEHNNTIKLLSELYKSNEYNSKLNSENESYNKKLDELSESVDSIQKRLESNDKLGKKRHFLDRLFRREKIKINKEKKNRKFNLKTLFKSLLAGLSIPIVLSKNVGNFISDLTDDNPVIDFLSNLVSKIFGYIGKGWDSFKSTGIGNWLYRGFIYPVKAITCNLFGVEPDDNGSYEDVTIGQLISGITKPIRDWWATTVSPYLYDKLDNLTKNSEVKLNPEYKDDILMAVINYLGRLIPSILESGICSLLGVTKEELALRGYSDILSDAILSKLADYLSTLPIFKDISNYIDKFTSFYEEFPDNILTKIKSWFRDNVILPLISFIDNIPGINMEENRLEFQKNSDDELRAKLENPSTTFREYYTIKNILNERNTEFRYDSTAPKSSEDSKLVTELKDYIKNLAPKDDSLLLSKDEKTSYIRYLLNKYGFESPSLSDWNELVDSIDNWFELLFMAIYALDSKPKPKINGYTAPIINTKDLYDLINKNKIDGLTDDAALNILRNNGDFVLTSDLINSYFKALNDYIGDKFDYSSIDALKKSVSKSAGRYGSDEMIDLFSSLIADSTYGTDSFKELPKSSVSSPILNQYIVENSIPTDNIPAVTDIIAGSTSMSQPPLAVGSNDDIRKLILEAMDEYNKGNNTGTKYQDELAKKVSKEVTNNLNLGQTVLVPVTQIKEVPTFSNLGNLGEQ